MDSAGTVVGDRYEFLERLGRGGQAEVWLAADRRLDGKRVAVKRLFGFRLGEEASTLDLERARREAYAASALTHPSIVAVTDFVLDHGEPFIVMEYVAGPTLDTATGLSIADAVRIMGQIADALTEAHEAHIVHRDIKPANILLDRRGRAKLADFGIARRPEDSRFTSTGMFTGTVAYLAPELLDGSDPGPASDIWSLGATLFEVAEGRKAFAAPTTPALLMAIVHGPLPIPTRTPELAPLLATMLNRDPAARPSAEQVANELTALTARATVVSAARDESPVATREERSPDPHADERPPPDHAADAPTGVTDDQEAGTPTRLATPLSPPERLLGRPRRRRIMLAGGAAALLVAAATVGIVVADKGSDRVDAPSGQISAARDGLGTIGSGGKGRYTIGVQATLTGAQAGHGRSMLNAVTLAVDRVNAQDGGFHIDVVTEDDGDVTSQAHSAAQALIARDAVVGVIGPTLNGPALATAPAYSGAGLTVITPTVTAPGLLNSDIRTVHQIVDDDAFVAASAYSFARGQRHGAFAVIDGSAYSRALYDRFDTFSQPDHVVGSNVDPTPVARAAKRHNALFYSGSTEGAAKLAKALRATGYTGLRIATDRAATVDFLTRAGAAAEGWYFAVPGTDTTTDSGTALFVKAYLARFHLPPPRFSLEAFDATNTLIEAIRTAAKSGPVTRAKVEARVDATQYAGVSTRVTFDPAGFRNGLMVTLYRVEHGRLRSLGYIDD